MKSIFILRRTIICLCLSLYLSAAFLLAGALNAQAPPLNAPANAAKGDSTAIALMARVLRGMGDTAFWRSVGAATNNVTIAKPNSVTEQLQWDDDWSGTSMLSRRKSATGGSNSSAVVASGLTQTHIGPNGSQMQYPRDPDLLIMAVGYPGAAILRSLQRADCTFSAQLDLPGLWPRFPEGTAPDETRIYEHCVEPEFINGLANLVWEVNANTAVLKGLWLPVRGMPRSTLGWEHLRYTAFQNIGGASLPQSLTIKRPSGRIDQLTFGVPRFSSNLPASTFALPQQ